ncbi:sulfate permease [Ascobolus immersus RN42]|uniref:Sulfate permease n=1 Tax=Ascobolus immersus RN42 TaxID=1160509 RepID=A0A3N4HUU4_ASCIM|nr:sulfate permease [Ascobolus immersus RN42]
MADISSFPHTQAPYEIEKVAPQQLGYPTDEKNGFSSPTPTAREVPDFHDRTISTKDWAARTFDDVPGQIREYLVSLFPIATWIYRYNLTWLTGDVIAGLTVGAVVVPQGMSYSLLAGLPAEYGLYSSFIGVFIYCFFATSKDVTIGPVAVMSLEVAKVIHHVQEHHDYAAPVIASALAMICGLICLALGLLRIGFLLEFIPAPAVAGFMTGSAFTIASGQIPSLLGIQKKLNTRESAYKVVINTLKNLKYTKLDAAFGLTALFGLYFIRWALETAGKRWPKYRKTCFFANVMRNGLVIIIVTVFAYVTCRNDPPDAYRISILKNVPRGFKNVGAPKFDLDIIKALGPHIPVATIILLLEHIAIAKSFGRINDYKIVPDQELIAIGFTNIIATFFNAYPATGSFSRTALKSKSGVRTPAAGIITGIVVLLALYALTSLFYWIPTAGLSAIIIHAVGDLMSHPRQVYIFWRVQPLEAIIFLAAVFITIFTNIENGIYVSIIVSVALLLYRIARPRGHFLGRLTLADGSRTRNIYVPIDRRTINPDVKVLPPPPGVVVYRPTESFTYPNASTQCDVLVDEVKRITKRGRPNAYLNLGDRPWNDPGPRAGLKIEDILKDKRPILRAVVFDFSAVATIDTTGVQSLVDTRRQINKYADREVEFHFANIISPWVRRSLLAGGFGTGAPMQEITEVAAVVPQREGLHITDSRADIDAEPSTLARVRKYVGNTDYKDKRFQHSEHYDLSPYEERGEMKEKEKSISSGSSVGEENWGAIVATDTPFFHIDIPDLSRMGVDAKLEEIMLEFGGSGSGSDVETKEKL